MISHIPRIVAAQLYLCLHAYFSTHCLPCFCCLIADVKTQNNAQLILVCWWYFFLGYTRRKKSPTPYLFLVLVWCSPLRRPSSPLVGPSSPCLPLNLNADGRAMLWPLSIVDVCRSSKRRTPSALFKLLSSRRLSQPNACSHYVTLESGHFIFYHLAQSLVLLCGRCGSFGWAFVYCLSRRGPFFLFLSRIEVQELGG